MPPKKIVYKRALSETLYSLKPNHAFFLLQYKFLQSLVYSKGQQNFSGREHTVHILSFAGHMVSVTTT